VIRRTREFKPFATRGRRAIVAILVTFCAFFAGSVLLSTSATSRSKDRAEVVRVAARQRNLAERYVKEVLLAKAGGRADPATTAAALKESADVLLEGGTAPAIDGDDDETVLGPADDPTFRSQLRQSRRMVNDLVATGDAYLAGRPVEAVKPTAGERIEVEDPVRRLQVLAALSSNVTLNSVRNVATATDRNITSLIKTQVGLGAGGLALSLLLAWALVAATRRQTAHFRSLVTSSTDLVLVFGSSGCRYASKSVRATLGRSDEDLLEDGFASFVHADDAEAVQSAATCGTPQELVFRIRNRFGEWRHLEAHVTDLRSDRQVAGVVLNARDITERVTLEEELTRQAFHDSLTGLANRALFRDRVDQALARSERSRSSLSLLLVDLDGFKQVNDALGHDAGDRLLREVAYRFGDVKRAGDTLARLGGDEFALLLEGANEHQAEAFAHRLLESLRDPVHVKGHELPIDASIGVVVHPGGVGDSEELIRHADLAMYAAKKGGRGRYEVFHADMAREAGETLTVEQELRAALDMGQIEVHYQPEVHPDSGAVVGVESLVRWRSPSRGIVMPDLFIPVAESSGLIHPIGEFVLRTACRQTARWLSDGVIEIGSFITWVNVSGRQLTAGGTADQVRAVLAETELPAELLGLEVTETAMVGEGAAIERARAELRALHDEGVRIAVDDFGTGFSSLDHLRQLPVDLIKVDRSFIQGVESDARDAAITGNLASLAHALGLEAIAEGVETESQLSQVRELGCDLAQGFLFARPMPSDEATAMLLSRRRLSREDGAAPVGVARNPAAAPVE
jgi:diguanylate cyclase (GGDEF)-like protein/PAS domain S-box-containing protein